MYSHRKPEVRVQGQQNVSSVRVDEVLLVSELQVVKHSAFIQKHKTTVVVDKRSTLFFRREDRVEWRFDRLGTVHRLDSDGVRACQAHGSREGRGVSRLKGKEPRARGREQQSFTYFMI